MSQIFRIHPTHPQLRLLRQAVQIIQRGGIVVYPTDSCYAIGCRIGDKQAMQRIRLIRQLGSGHHFTLICRDLSELASYAKVDNITYRLLKTYTPGPFTFLLNATKEVPRKLLHPNRKTIGIRVPDNLIALALLEELGEPMLSTSLIMPTMEAPLIDPEAISEILGGQVDLIIDGGYCGLESTTMIDLTGERPIVIRRGKGEISTLLQ